MNMDDKTPKPQTDSSDFSLSLSMSKEALRLVIAGLLILMLGAAYPSANQMISGLLPLSSQANTQNR